MMIRIYWNMSIQQPELYYSSTETIQRDEGGWWFAETIDSKRSAFRVLDRILINTKHEQNPCIIEVLEPLSDDFIQTPCWNETEPPQVWKNHEPLENCPQVYLREQVLQQQVQQQVQQQQQEQFLLQHQLSFPLEQMSLVLSQPMVLQHLGSLSTLLHETIHKIHSKSYSLPVLQEQSLKQHPQHLKQKEEPVLQKKHTHQVSLEETGSQKGVSLQHSSQSTKVDPVFVEKKGIQTGALCSPMILPEKQVPRKTTHHRKEPRVPHHKTHHKEIVSTKCLIDLRES